MVGDGVDSNVGLRKIVFIRGIIGVLILIRKLERIKSRMFKGVIWFRNLGVLEEDEVFGMKGMLGGFRCWIRNLEREKLIVERKLWFIK